MKTWADIVAITGTLLFMIQMLTPIKTFTRVAKLQSTEDLSLAPYNTAFLSCFAWMLYGYCIPDTYVILTNAYGALLQFCYVCCFWFYANPKLSVSKQIIFSVLVCAISTFYCWYEPNSKLLSERMAIFCTIITFAFFAAPFSNLGHVLKTRNADSLPAMLIVFTFVLSNLWMIYGVLIDDLALKVTNFVGVVLSAIQLLLILRFSYFMPRKIEPLLVL